MRQPNGLTKLHALAEWTRRDPGWAASHAFDYVQHGLAAVRAIRDNATASLVYSVDSHRESEVSYVVRESRLAFRAALRAVGINGSL